jgi:hypothetical protein
MKKCNACRKADAEFQGCSQYRLKQSKITDETFMNTHFSIGITHTTAIKLAVELVPSDDPRPHQPAATS